MKKKIIIVIWVIVLLIIGFLMWNNRTIYKITLDINPSIEIDLGKNKDIKRIVPLNDDAKKFITKDMNKLSLDEMIEKLVTSLYEDEEVMDGPMVILVHASDGIDGEKIRQTLIECFDRFKIGTDVIVIDEISKEDKELAKKYKITEAKAAYINGIVKKEDINFDALVTKSVHELREALQSGRYCDDGYILDGDSCLKEINQVAAQVGDVCPEGYFGFDNKCYKETEAIELDELICRDEFKLVDNKCEGEESYEAKANFTCDVGEPIRRDRLPLPSLRDAGDPYEYLCADESSGQKPSERCYLQEHAIIDGKCGMGPKPLLPTPTGCEGDDINYNGGCYDLTPDEPYICPNGDRYDTNDFICLDTVKYVKANGGYTCENGDRVKSDECFRKVYERPMNKYTCPSGYTLVDYNHCVDKNVSTGYVSGNICPMQDSRLRGNKCIIYEVVEANGIK